MYLFLSIYPLGILFFLIHYFKTPVYERTTHRVLELFLLYMLVFWVGITSLMAFIGLTFMDDYVAQFTNWPRCPFEQQLANVNLAFGFLGIMCIWFRRLFWVATIFGFSIWIFGDGIHHLYHYFAYSNATPGNVGVPLITDLLIPPILLGVLFIYYKTINHH